ncbi:putative polyprenol reductase [Helianthus anomalus]
MKSISHFCVVEHSSKTDFMFAFQNLTVPHSFFSHFYVVGTLWTTMLLVAVWSYAMMIDQLNDVWLSVFMLLLMEAQVMRRFYESVNVFNYSPSARFHISGYLLGVL